LKPVGSFRRALLVASIAIIMAVSPSFIAIAHASSPGIPTSIAVSVGYADTEGRNSNAESCAYCFPSPWCGTPGVQFIGASTNYDGNPTDTGNCMNGDWDGGAIMVTNTGTTPITFTNLTVTLPLPASGLRGSPICPEPPRPIIFALWFGPQYYFDNKSELAYFGGPITVPPGGQAIFTGTSSDGSYTCPKGDFPAGPKGSANATYDFDTSDAAFMTGCALTNDTVSDPRVTFWAVGYSPTTYIDVGHVIDTGGVDVGNCQPTAVDPQWGHEDLGWRPVNDSCGEMCPGGVQFGVAANTATASGSTTPVTVAGGSGEVSATVAYGLAVVAVVFIIATGYLATGRGGRPAS
jgi:hypothetical protein